MTKRILVADDDPRFREDFERYFRSLGHIVDTAGNYIGTVALLDLHVYDLIVCDNGMPISQESRPYHKCGLELLAHSKFGINKNTPFVLNTYDDMQKTKDIVQQLGGIYRHKDDKTPARELFDSLLKSGAETSRGEKR